MHIPCMHTHTQRALKKKKILLFATTIGDLGDYVKGSKIGTGKQILFDFIYM